MQIHFAYLLHRNEFYLKFDAQCIGASSKRLKARGSYGTKARVVGIYYEKQICKNICKRVLCSVDTTTVCVRAFVLQSSHESGNFFL